jgi:hypothetical protein
MSTHSDISEKYNAMLRRAITKRQQGLALTEVPLTLEDGIVMMKLMLTLADELDAKTSPDSELQALWDKYRAMASVPKGDDDHTGE